MQRRHAGSPLNGGPSTRPTPARPTYCIDGRRPTPAFSSAVSHSRAPLLLVRDGRPLPAAFVAAGDALEVRRVRALPAAEELDQYRATVVVLDAQLAPPGHEARARVAALA